MFKLGVIGTGSQGLRFIETIKTMENVEISVVSNRHGKFQNYVCMPWQQLMLEKLDGIIIAANPKIHLDILAVADKLKIPVLLEKPAVLSYKQALTLKEYTIPILVDYTHLFSPNYQLLKEEVRYKHIKRIIAMGYNKGPYRDYSPLYDYAPHDLSMCLDLLGDLEIVSKKRIRNLNGVIYKLNLKSLSADIEIKTGNGSLVKRRKMLVYTNDGTYLYDGENNKDYKLPLQNVVKHFIDVIKGEKCKIPLDMTLKIHKLLKEIDG